MQRTGTVRERGCDLPATSRWTIDVLTWGVAEPSLVTKG